MYYSEFRRIKFGQSSHLASGAANRNRHCIRDWQFQSGVYHPCGGGSGIVLCGLVCYPYFYEEYQLFERALHLYQCFVFRKLLLKLNIWAESS